MTPLTATRSGHTCTATYRLITFDHDIDVCPRGVAVLILYRHLRSQMWTPRPPSSSSSVCLGMQGFHPQYKSCPGLHAKKDFKLANLQFYRTAVPHFHWCSYTLDLSFWTYLVQVLVRDLWADANCAYIRPCVDSLSLFSVSWRQNVDNVPQVSPSLIAFGSLSERPPHGWCVHMLFFEKINKQTKERNGCLSAFYDYSKPACHKLTGTRSINNRCL